MAREVYLDLDGVLADFDGWLLKKEPKLSFSKEEIEELVNRYYETAFSESEVISRHSIFFFNYENIKVLSTTVLTKENIYLYEKDSKTAKKKLERLCANKIDWVLRNFPLIKRENIIILTEDSKKYKYCKPGDLLVDDSKRMAREWREKGKGNAILVYNKYRKY